MYQEELAKMFDLIRRDVRVEAQQIFHRHDATDVGADGDPLAHLGDLPEHRPRQQVDARLDAPREHLDVLADEPLRKCIRNREVDVRVTLEVTHESMRTRAQQSPVVWRGIPKQMSHSYAPLISPLRP